MTERAVVIAGGGPPGLMLAGELALAGIGVVIVGRRDNRERTTYASVGALLPQSGVQWRLFARGR
jgi:3-(3-hydroxy-phenyl)propionate hydroxylase